MWIWQQQIDGLLIAFRPVMKEARKADLKNFKKDTETSARFFFLHKVYKVLGEFYYGPDSGA